jgi:hypothetical protein
MAYRGQHFRYDSHVDREVGGLGVAGFTACDGSARDSRKRELLELGSLSQMLGGNFMTVSVKKN